MRMEIAAKAPELAGTLIVPLGAEGAFGKAAKRLDDATKGLLRLLVESEKPRLKHGKILELPFAAGRGLARAVLIVLAKEDGPKKLDLERAGASLWGRVKGRGPGTVTVLTTAGIGLPGTEAQAVAALAHGLKLASYRFDKYKKPDPEEDQSTPDAILFEAPAAAKPALEQALILADAVAAARDLVSEPGNVLYPETFADAAKGLKSFGLKVDVLDEKQLAKLGMNAILGVGLGSSRPPRVVTLEWSGGKKSEAPIALVGKGVCFDTGGISIKPAQGMEEMKWDMAGAGAVFGAMRAIAAAKLPLNVVGVLGLAENMPSGTAQRPGDVVRAADGTTIEVVNTDAEGRLVLADAIWLTRDRFKPKVLVDLATLTGAIVVALGSEHAGLFATDEDLAKRLTDAGAATGETLWRMPLGKGYTKQIKSDIADIKNLGRAREAGGTAGAVFIEHFAKDTPWAHLDIAAVAWTSREMPLVPKGATGFGVRLLDAFVRSYL